MSLFSDNIRYLRLQKSISQEKLAEGLLITRARYVKYESGTSEAPYDILKRISHFYHVSIDVLLSVDIRKVDMDGLIKLEDNRILLPIAIDKKGENIIEIIPQKAKAGYLTGYSDPEFIEGLQHLSIPFLSRGKYRAFPIEGDSMPPHREGSFIIGEFTESLSDIKESSCYILLTRNEGIIYKRVKEKQNDRFILSSDNKAYDDFTVLFADVLEIWKFSASLATFDYGPDDINTQTLKEALASIQKDIKAIKLVVI